MKKSLKYRWIEISCLLISIISLDKTNGQVPTIEWQQYFGGNSAESFGPIFSLTNGYLVLGGTSSNNGDVIGFHGGDLDSWLVRINNAGNIIWQHCYGGTLRDGHSNITTTSFGNFILVGQTQSDDGDVVGNHLAGTDDAWLVEIDSSGNIIRQKCFGGSGDDGFYYLLPLSDGSYIATGFSTSSDGDLAGFPSLGDFDVWIVKIDSSWNILWQKRYGGSYGEAAIRIIPKQNGGYKVAAGTYSYDGDITQHYGNGWADVWILDLDSTGNLISQKCYGGSFQDLTTDMWMGSNGAFYIGAQVKSNDWDVSGNHGYFDYWVFKINNTGSIVWQKCYGGLSGDKLNAMTLTDSGEILLCGTSASSDGDVTGIHFGGGGCMPYACDDIWLVKIDTSGNLLWQKCFGGSEVEGGYGVLAMNDSSYLVVGDGGSIDGDATGANYHGFADGWVLKLSILPDVFDESHDLFTDFSCHFNSANEILAIQFHSNRLEKLCVSLYDIAGRIVVNQDFETYTGINKYEIRTGPLSNGIYHVRLETAGGSVTKKVVSY